MVELDLLIKGTRRYIAVHLQLLMLFYLCKGHECVHVRLQRSVELKDYFTETRKENQ